MTSEFIGSDYPTPSEKAFLPKLHICSLKTHSCFLVELFPLPNRQTLGVLDFRIVSCRFGSSHTSENSLGNSKKWLFLNGFEEGKGALGSKRRERDFTVPSQVVESVAKSG